MNQASTHGTSAPESSTAGKREVAESAFEYLLGEILALELPPAKESPSGIESSEEKILEKLRRLDELGFQVGYRYMEKLSSSQRYLGTEPLDLVKFLCKDFWEELFKKKIDKLQTNHKGVFVLTDLKFKWLERYASDDTETKQSASILLHIPCGIIQGALANLGLPTIVTADFNTLPSCTFSIRIHTAS